MLYFKDLQELKLSQYVFHMNSYGERVCCLPKIFWFCRGQGGTRCPASYLKVSLQNLMQYTVLKQLIQCLPAYAWYITHLFRSFVCCLASRFLKQMLFLLVKESIFTVLDKHEYIINQKSIIFIILLPLHLTLTKQ